MVHKRVSRALAMPPPSEGVRLQSPEIIGPPIYQLYNTFNTLPIHLLYNQKILELVHCSVFHVCDLPSVL